MADKRWVPFYFEGNQAWGLIEDADEWERIKFAYKESSINLAEARQHRNRVDPVFGLYPEFTGDDTLGDFAERNHMDIGYKKEDSDGYNINWTSM